MAQNHIDEMHKRCVNFLSSVRLLFFLFICSYLLAIHNFHLTAAVACCSFTASCCLLYIKLYYIVFWFTPLVLYYLKFRKQNHCHSHCCRHGTNLITESKQQLQRNAKNEHKKTVRLVNTGIDVYT